MSERKGQTIQCPKEKDKTTNNGRQNIAQETKDWQHEFD